MASYRKITLFLALVFVSCVENKVFIHVHPDGQTFFKFESRGDSLDVSDGDFVHPYHLKNWATEISTVQTENETNWRRITKGIVYDSVIVLQSPGGSQLGYKFHKSKISSWYKDSYEVKVVIEGRRIKQDYPQLYNAVLTDKMDSLNWLPEALTVLMYKGLKDIGHDSLSPEQSLWNHRLVNHLRNSFAKFSSLKDLERIQKDRVDYLEKLLAPFHVDPSLPAELAINREKHEKILRTSLDLEDDFFIWKVLLPGSLFATNATRVVGDTLIWELGLDSLLSHNYTLYGSTVIYTPDKIQISLIFSLILGWILLVIIIWFFSRKIF